MENQNKNKMTRDGDNYFTAMTVHYCLGIILASVSLILVAIRILNPFWFREYFWNWTDSVVWKFVDFQMKVKRKVYFWGTKNDNDSQGT